MLGQSPGGWRSASERADILRALFTNDGSATFKAIKDDPIILRCSGRGDRISSSGNTCRICGATAEIHIRAVERRGGLERHEFLKGWKGTHYTCAAVQKFYDRTSSQYRQRKHLPLTSRRVRLSCHADIDPAAQILPKYRQLLCAYARPLSPGNRHEATCY